MINSYDILQKWIDESAAKEQEIMMLKVKCELNVNGIIEEIDVDTAAV